MEEETLGDSFLGCDDLGEELADEDQGLVVNLDQLDVFDGVLNDFDLLWVVRVLVVCAWQVRLRFDLSEAHCPAL